MRYKIKKGKHCSSPWWARWWFQPHHAKGFINFSESCYTAVEEIPGWNKLCGVQSWRIHNHSARLGWRATEDGQIKIAGYVYTNGARFSREITTISRDESQSGNIIFNIYWTHGAWVFSVNGRSVTIAAQKPRGQWFKSVPYFGGKSTAPCDLEIGVDLM